MRRRTARESKDCQEVLGLKAGRMKTEDDFLKAYHDFRETIDLSRGGVLPDLDTLIGYLLMGIPRVPADADLSQNAQLEAVDQRIAILKAVFVETNRSESEGFLDQGLLRYDEAGRITKDLLKDSEPSN